MRATKFRSTEADEPLRLGTEAVYSPEELALRNQILGLVGSFNFDLSQRMYGSACPD